MDAMMDPNQINDFWLAHVNKIGKQKYEIESEDVKEVVRKEIDRVMSEKRAMENALAGAGSGDDDERLRHLQR